jgi:glycosyltransferase involved in cell wall biosynthesis
MKKDNLMKSFKIDLHHHCYYSRVTDNKLMSAFFVNECYDSPEAVYRTAKKRGMNAVTITDHNTIAGGLKLKEKYDDFFISEEICTFFPEDNFRMHVVALDIDEKIHAEISKLRFNVYDLVQYFKQENILHFLAHPAWGPSTPPQRVHFEKFIALFSKWEFLNGSRSWKNHDFVKALAESYTLELGCKLARKHGLIEPTHSRIIGSGGSDAHNIRNTATTYSEVVGATNYKEFLQGYIEGRATYTGDPQTILPFTQSVYDILGKHYGFGQPFIVRKVKGRATKALAKMHFSPLKKFVRGFHRPSFTQEKLLKKLDKHYQQFFSHVFKKLGSRRGIDLTKDLIQPLANLALNFGPLLASANYKYNFDYNLPKADDLFPDINGDRPKRVAVIGDNLDANHGVSFRVKHMVEAAHGKSHELVPVTCGEGDSGKFHLIRPLKKFPIPEHPSEHLYIPSLVDMLLMFESEEIDLVHITTPGPLGFIAMLAAKLVGAPLVGSYHTDLVEYAKHYQQNTIFEKVFAKAQAYFYNQCDMVFTLSQHSKKLLIETGVKADKIQLMKTGINQSTFNDNIDGEKMRTKINPDNKFLILFAGRIELEKNINLLLTSFEKIYRANSNAILILAGNGNLKAGIENGFAKKFPVGTVKFLDWVEHGQMAEVYAAADLMLFPSNTETFGNVILEAQSCGLPTIVSNAGASAEIVEHARSGFVCNADDSDAYARAALLIMGDPKMRLQMSKNAAELGRRYNWDGAVDDLFRSYENFVDNSVGTSAQGFA